MKFKVGDKVKITSKSSHHFEVGDIVKIVQINGSDYFAERNDGEDWWIDDDDCELYVE